ncbi:hypothetical protein HDU93_001485 [Gonapodya sp. JEL0774]|nr:hypothetical protein HDU93_001485 [Gonapodya sp. JEL0774]
MSNLPTRDEVQQQLQQQMSNLPTRDEVERMVKTESSVAISTFNLNQCSRRFFSYPPLIQPTPKEEPPYPWNLDLQEDSPEQREQYLAYLCSVLNVWKYRNVQIFDASQYKTLLKVNIGDISVTGTTDVLVTQAGPVETKVLSALCGIEIKKPGNGSSGVAQACAELLAIARIQEISQGKPFVVLTDLDEYWMIIWLSYTLPGTNVRPDLPQPVGQIMDRTSAIMLMRAELEQYAAVWNPDVILRGTKQPPAPGSGGSDPGIQEEEGSSDGSTGGTHNHAIRSFSERVPFSLAKHGSDGYVDGIDHFDIVDLEDEPHLSYYNAKKWAVNFIRAGGIVGLVPDCELRV